MKTYVEQNAMRLMAVVVVLGMVALGAFPDPALAGMVIAAPFLVGDTDPGLKELLEKQNKAWEEFKAANNARLEAVEKKGYAPTELVGKVDVINADLNKLSKDVSDAIAKMQRPGAGNDGKGLTPAQLEHKAAFGKFLRKGDEAGLQELERKAAMNSTDDTQGGYLVHAELDKEIDRIAATMSAMNRLARVVTIGTRSWQKRVKTSGMTMARPGEGGTSGETTEPRYSRIEVVVHPAEVEPWVFNETLEDADIDLEGDLAMEAAVGFSEGAGAEFITGNGVAKAMGITSYTNVANASYAWGKVGYIVSGKSAAFASVAPADAFVSLQHALKAQYRNGAAWIMNDTTLGVARQMKDASGAYYLWNPDPLIGFGGRFLGSPVEVDDNMPAIAANSYSVAYGNFQRGYAIVNRTGTTLIRDNVTAKGTTKFNFRRRFGGGIYNFEAIKLMKFST
jgi:HK97 family phage major capsid protein